MPHCFVPGCKTSHKKKPAKVTFHSIRSTWLPLIGRDPLTPILQQRICSLHFLEEDLERIGSLTKVKQNASPTLALPNKFPTKFPLENFQTEDLKIDSKCIKKEQEELETPTIYDLHVKEEFNYPISGISEYDNLQEKPFDDLHNYCQTPETLFLPNNILDLPMDFEAVSETSTLESETQNDSLPEMAEFNIVERRRLIETIHSYSRCPEREAANLIALKKKVKRYSNIVYKQSKLINKLKLELKTLKNSKDSSTT